MRAEVSTRLSLRVALTTSVAPRGNSDVVACPHLSAAEDPREDAFARHDAVAEPLVDRAVLVALLADARDLRSPGVTFL